MSDQAESVMQRFGRIGKELRQALSTHPRYERIAEPGGGWIEVSDQLHAECNDALEAGDEERAEALFDEALRWENREAWRDLHAVVDQLHGVTGGQGFNAAFLILASLREQAEGPPKRRALSRQTRFLVYRRDGYQCVECGEHEIHELSVDHIVPVSAGGDNDPRNLRTLCRRCNSRKGPRP